MAIASIERLSHAETRWMLETVDALDRVFLEEVYDKIAKEHAAKAKKSAAKGRR